MRPRSFAKLCMKQLHYVYVVVYTQVVKYVCVCAQTYIFDFNTLIKAYRSQWYLNIPKVQVWMHFAQTTQYI